jgi:integrase
MPNLKAKIGLRQIEALEPNSLIWDTVIPGFNVRRQFSEVITYSVIYRNRDGSQKWFKLGRHPILTPHLARQEAVKVLRAVTVGEDPSAERQSLRNSMTVATLCGDYEADMQAHRINGKKASTILTDQSRIKKHIRPHLGKLKVISISSEQVEEFMHSMSPGSARRITALLSAIFSYAVKRKLRPDNPCSGLAKPSDVKKLRRLSESEYVHFGSALKNNDASDIFMLLAVTGFRSGEARLLKWSQLDLERHIATLDGTKTGLSIRPLSSAAIDIIKRQKQNSIYVFNDGGPIPKLTRRWKKLGMPPDVTPHTLRHSFASLAGDLGLSDSTIAGLLGHSRQSMTSRYIHLDKALIAAADVVAAETLRLMRA